MWAGREIRISIDLKRAPPRENCGARSRDASKNNRVHNVFLRIEIAVTALKEPQCSTQRSFRRLSWCSKPEDD